MYVCICRQVTCGQIRAAASEGVDNVRALKEQLGVASQCGKCAGCARGVLEEIHGSKVSSNSGQSS
jgi:bacterioferritin-associated ferredoxin